MTEFTMEELWEIEDLARIESSNTNDEERQTMVLNLAVKARVMIGEKLEKGEDNDRNHS